MPRPTTHLVIDARPRGPQGPLAGEVVQGQSVLGLLLDLALGLDDQPVAIHARLDEHTRLSTLVADRPGARYVFVTGPPPEDSMILRTDRLYDAGRLRRALRRRRDAESAVIWRLDQPHGLSGAEAELVRRQTYQPLGAYWALAPARALATRLVPTRVRPNALTLAAAGLMLGTSAAVALAHPGAAVQAIAALALAAALVLDTADGHLARLQGTASEFGRWLDAVLDELGDMALHAAIAWSAFARDGHVAWLVLGMIYGMGKYLFMVTTVPVEGTGHLGQPHVTASPAPRPLGVASRRTRLLRWARLAGHADIRWHLWIVLALFGRLDAALVAYAVYFPARAVGSAVRKAVRHA